MAKKETALVHRPDPDAFAAEQETLETASKAALEWKLYAHRLEDLIRRYKRFRTSQEPMESQFWSEATRLLGEIQTEKPPEAG